jgi:hypothetical protein
MSIRIMIFGVEGDGSAYAAAAQIRSLVHQMRADADVLMVTDAKQHKLQGVEQFPTINIDGVAISQGYVPSRNEIQRAIQSRLDSLQGKRGSEIPI